jgi:PQQ-dependent catabolism-associated CXXCW motif protein
MERNFRTSLERVTGGDRDRAIVLYCIADCWMSWNATRRAHRYGYRNLFWYKHGTDGWAEHGLELVEAEPAALERIEGVAE